MDQSQSSDGREPKLPRKSAPEKRIVQTELSNMREDVDLHGGDDNLEVPAASSRPASMASASEHSYGYAGTSNPQWKPNPVIAEPPAKKNQFVPDPTEMETRPSWCDAGYALDKIHQNEATGNIYALHIRKVMQRGLFQLGVLVYSAPLVLLIISAVLLGVCMGGLYYAEMEMNLEKLWVENGGQLQKEIEYKKSIGLLAKEHGEDDPGNGVSASGFQVMIQTSERDVQNVKSMRKHLRVAERVAEIEVRMYARTWKFQDVCYKLPYDPITKDTDPLLRMIYRELLVMIPCLVITPLDCFWDGSKLLGPTPPFGLTGTNLTWMNFNPIQVIDELIHGNGTLSLFVADLLPPIRRSFHDIGISDGYQSRYCLDPHDPHCPSTAPNYANKTEAPVKRLIAEGCGGFAPSLMRWPKDLIVSSFSKDESNEPDSVQTAGSRALQSIFQVMDPGAMYHKYKDNSEVKDWNISKAEAVILAWSRNFSKQIELADEEERFHHSRTNFHSINQADIIDIISEFSTISPWRIVGGYVLMLIYAYLTLRNRTASRSQGGVAMVGVLLIAASVASGLGLTCYLGVRFNAASIQVLPFLLLGLGVDDMFLLACHFNHIAFLSYIPIEKRIAELLKRVGVSVVLTSISIMAAFFCSLIIPMPALQAFGLQAGVVTIFNLIVVLVAFPALLSLDLQRRLSNRADLFCCFKSSTPNAFENEEDAHAETNPYVTMTTPSTPVIKGNVQEDGQQRSDTPSNLVAVQRSRSAVYCNKFVDKISKVHLYELVSDYYGPFLLRPAVQATVLIISAVVAVYAAYEASLVRDGLDLSDVIPRGTRQHAALSAQAKYFSFYQIEIMTREFDYAKQQGTLMSLHRDVTSSRYVVRNTDGSREKIWLDYFRKWLRKVQATFDADWTKGHVNETAWSADADVDTVLAYKMMVQTGNEANPIQSSRVGCVDATKPCLKVDKVRFVDGDGLIREDGFYHYLTAWSNQDAFSYAASQANFKPKPPSWKPVDKSNTSNTLPPAHRILHAQMPYFVNGLRENEDFVELILHIRAACDSRESDNFSSFPSGYPFLFWQQYIDLRQWLFVAVGAVLATIFIVLALFLCNPYTALIMILVLMLILTELLGYMGVVGVKLSAMPAVTLVAAVGIGLEFIVHLTLAFVTTCGSTHFRVIQSLRHTTAPVVDGAISTLLGVIMLAGARFDFIIKYFFQVLVVLLVLGVFNGLVLLPVLLNQIGPKSEIRFIKKDKSTEKGVTNTTHSNQNISQLVLESSR